MKKVISDLRALLSPNGMANTGLNIVGMIGSMKSLLLTGEKGFLIAAQIITALIGLATGKLIAVYISPTEFGKFNLGFALYTFLFTILLSPFIQFLKTTNHSLLPKIGSKHYFTSLIILSSLLFLALVLFFRIYYNTFPSFWVVFILILIIPLNGINSIITDFFNVKGQLSLFSISAITKALSALLFLATVCYFFINEIGGEAILWTVQVVGFIGGILFGLRRYALYRGSYFEISLRNFFKRYMVFSWPLIILAFWTWINNYFDRYVIDYFMAEREVGIYNANCSIGSKFYLLLSPIFLMPLTHFVYRNDMLSRKKQLIKKYFKAYLISGLLLLIAITLTQNLIGAIFLSSEYKQGFHLISWAALSFLIMTATFLVETIFYVEQKTRVILISNVAAAIANIIGNFYLIQLWGLTGCIIASVFSSLIRFIIVIYYFKKL